ncbi:MAG: chromate transporter [Clostridia bacterium]|nr:chromate transporter [Clostridia bacterium]
MKELLEMFLAFSRVGALTFGGGYAMLPILQGEVVEKKKWITNEEMMDFYAIGQCLPGLIAVNTASFIGNKLKGTKGGYACALGVVFPSLVIITIIAAFISGFSELPVVRNAFAGIRVCVCVLILNAVVKLWKKAIIDLKTFVIFAVIFSGSTFTDINPILYVVGAAVCGIILSLTSAKGGQKK